MASVSLPQGMHPHLLREWNLSKLSLLTDISVKISYWMVFLAIVASLLSMLYVFTVEKPKIHMQWFRALNH